MLSFFKLIRLPNLLVVAALQWLFYRLLNSFFVTANIATALSVHEQWALIAATVSVTLAGYVYNDMADAGIDRYNGDVHHLVGSAISRRLASWLAFLFVLLGFLLSLLLAFSQGKKYLLWLFPLSAGLLLVYSRYIKPYPLSGNLLVAFLCAAVGGLVLLAESSGIASLFMLDFKGWQQLWRISGLFVTYAFGITLAREVIKDVEDREGDARFGRRTLVIAYGLYAAKKLVLFCNILVVFLLLLPLALQWVPFTDLQAGILSCVITALLLLGTWALFRAKEATDFRWLSHLYKLLMLLGLGWLCLLQLVV
jgi:4-hydroxybenzoate polyprenyltransferase